MPHVPYAQPLKATLVRTQTHTLSLFLKLQMIHLSLTHSITLFLSRVVSCRVRAVTVITLFEHAVDLAHDIGHPPVVLLGDHLLNKTLHLAQAFA